MKPQGLRLAVLCGVLFLSGTGALIFETLWLRLSGLAFGNSVWAAALILSSFMAGLALGNALAASSTIRRWRPLHFYAVLEVLVGLFGCTIVFVLPVLGDVLRPLWQTLWNYQPALLGLRFVVSFLILLVPTTAMGLTLPVIIEDRLLGEEVAFGRTIGFLYGSNTLGAMVGAILGEAYLIRAFGLYGTSLAAAVTVWIAATIALCLAKTAAILVPGKRQTGERRSLFLPLRFEEHYRPPWRLLFVSFGTGLIFLALEVIWFRFLRLYVVSTPTSFVVMLAVVLAGIGLGGIVGGAIHRWSAQLNRLLPILLLLSPIAVLSSYLLFPGEAVRTPAGAFSLGSWPKIGLLCLALMFPVSLLSGILFPIIAARVQLKVPDRMNSTGITTLFNTTGAAVGPLLASFILLPTLGYQSSLLCCAGGYALLSILLTERADWSLRKPTGMAFIALWIVIVVGFVFFPYRRDQAHFEHASRPYEMEGQSHVMAHVVKRMEGTSDTWQLLRRDLFGQPYYYRLLSNSFSMSATSPPNQRYMRLFAYLPLAFDPGAKDVLLICYGCGVTADAFTRKSNLERIDVADISKEVFALADFYSETNYSNPLRDPRVHAIVQDGRFFLQASPRQYDIISGEPPPPKVAGAVNLYTQEFFSLMRSRLKQGGIASFWLPINQLKVEETKAILRAFHNAFPNASVWGSDQDWIMMGINGLGSKVTEDELRQLWKDPATGADLRRIGIEVPQQLAALFLMDSDEIDRVTHDVAPVTDVYPKRLTDEPWNDEANYRFALEYLSAVGAVQRFVDSPLIHQIWPETVSPAATEFESFFLLRQSRYVSDTMGSNKLAELDLYLRHSSLRIPVLEVLGSDALRVSIAERVANKSATPPLEIMPDLIAGALAQRNINRAIQLLENERDRGAFNANDIFLLTYLYCLNGNVEKAETLIADNTAVVKKDSFVDWLWEKLKTDFGFHPPDAQQ